MDRDSPGAAPNRNIFAFSPSDGRKSSSLARKLRTGETIGAIVLLWSAAVVTSPAPRPSTRSIASAGRMVTTCRGLYSRRRMEISGE